MAIKKGFPIFFANINKTFFPLVMIRRNGYNIPAVGLDVIPAMGYMEVYHMVNGMGLKTVNQNVAVKNIFYCLVSINC